MAPVATQLAHHHRSTTKSSQKSFKSRHASKSTIKERQKGKVDATSLFERGIRKTPHQAVMSKLDRKNHAKQLRDNKHAMHVKAASVFSGKDAAPRIVAVVPLCEGIDQERVVRALGESVDIIEDADYAQANPRLYVERFKQTMTVIPVQRDLLTVLDACRVADYVVFVLSATEEVDDDGELLLRTIESQGVSNTIIVAQGIDSIEPAKKRPQVLASLKSYISHFLPATEKVSSLDTRQECVNVVRSICTSTPKGIRWREDRSWMMVEDVQWLGGKSAVQTDDATGEVVITGVVRGKGLKADRLLQIADWGHFQIDKIVAAPLETRRKAKAGAIAIEQEGQGAILESPSEDQDMLDELAPEEVLMEEDMDGMTQSIAPSERRGVLVDDHHYYSDEETKVEEYIPKKLPRGISKYQAAWYLGDISDSGSDMESVDERMFEDDDNEEDFGPGDGMDDNMTMGEGTQGGPSEYPESEMFLDPAPEDEAEAIQAYRKGRRNEAADDLEFPDEIELEPGVLARERLAKYRGLKSFRTSAWDNEEDRLNEPETWRRLLEINNYRGAKNRVINEALVGGVKAGTRCSIHLKAIPIRYQQQDANSTAPIAAFSLLRHEQKHASLNMSFNLSADVSMPIRSKTEIIVQCGPRRFIANPLFSSAGTTPNDVHKFARYLHPGRTAIATFTGPITWGSVPLLYFQRTTEPDSTQKLTFIGTGTCLPPSQSRVIAKRIILTGSPYKINKRVMTVRYMFFNTEDVAWFKALQLYTKRGRTGYIKESLGTHGYFKCTFDGKLNPMDVVAINLYKRVWPRAAKVWHGEMGELEQGEDGDGDGAWEGIDEVPELVMS